MTGSPAVVKMVTSPRVSAMSELTVVEAEAPTMNRDLWVVEVLAAVLGE